MDETEKEKEKLATKRRSSILKIPRLRNQLEEVETTETYTDILSNNITKAGRRVSFASSNFIKPFVSDPEKNTIWDTTIEENVNHTNSTQSSQEHSAHSSSKIRIDETKDDMELDFATKSRIFQDLENQTRLNESTVELTCQASNYDSEVEMGLTATINCDKSTGVCQMEVDETFAKGTTDMEFTCQVPTQFGRKSNQITYTQVDMSFTCHATEMTKSVRNGITTDEKENQNNSTVAYMKLSPQFLSSSNYKNQSVAQISENDKPERSSDMEFTCQFSDIPKTVNLDEKENYVVKNTMLSKLQFHYRQIDKENAVANNSTVLPVHIEYPCQNNPEASPTNMEFTCQFPKSSRTVNSDEKENVIVKNSNLESTVSDMELTCQLPIFSKGAHLNTENNKNQAVVLPSAPFLSQNPKRSTSTLVCQKIDASPTLSKPANIDNAVKSTEDTITNMEFTCQYSKLSKNVTSNEKKNSNLESTVSDMEFTNQLPMFLKRADRNTEDKENQPVVLPSAAFLSQNLKMSNSANSDEIKNNTLSASQLACQKIVGSTNQIPTLLKPTDIDNVVENTEATTTDMEFTCQFPKLSKTFIPDEKENQIVKISNLKSTVSEVDFSCKGQMLSKTADRDIDNKENLQVVDNMVVLPSTALFSQYSKMSKTANTDESVKNNTLSTSQLDCQKIVESAHPSPTLSKPANIDNAVKSTEDTITNMEFTCQFPKLSKTFNLDEKENQAVKISNFKSTVSDMNFSCQGQMLSKTADHDIDKENLQLVDNMVVSPSMAFPSQYPKMTKTANTDESVKNNALSTSQLYCQKIVGGANPSPTLSKLANIDNAVKSTEDTITNMEFTCQFSKLSKTFNLDEKENQAVKISNFKSTVSDMNFSCQGQMLSKTADHDIDNKENLQLVDNMVVSPSTDESVKNNALSTSQLHCQKIVGGANPSPTLSKPTVVKSTKDTITNMEFTCEFPKLSKTFKLNEKENQIVESTVSDMDFSRQLPILSKTANRDTDNKGNQRVVDNIAVLSSAASFNENSDIANTANFGECIKNNKLSTSQVQKIVGSANSSPTLSKPVKIDNVLPSNVELLCQVIKVPQITNMDIGFENTVKKSTLSTSQFTCQKIIGSDSDSTNKENSDGKNAVVGVNDKKENQVVKNCKVQRRIPKLSKTSNTKSVMDNDEKENQNVAQSSCQQIAEVTSRISELKTTNFHEKEAKRLTFDCQKPKVINFQKTIETNRTPEDLRFLKTLQQASEMDNQTWLTPYLNRIRIDAELDDQPKLKRVKSTREEQIVENLVEEKTNMSFFHRQSETSNLKTPESFHINFTNISSGADDTQHLLQCRYPVSFTSFNDSSDENSYECKKNLLANVNDTYVLKNKIPKKTEEDSLGIIPDEFLESVDNKSEEKLPFAKHQKKESKLVFATYPDCLAKIESLKKQREVISKRLEIFECRSFRIPLLTEICEVPKIASETTSDTSLRVPTVEEMIRKHQESAQNGWKLNSIDGDGAYTFSTLYNSLTFKVHINEETHRVCSLETGSRLKRSAKPIARYVFKLFLDKLSDNNLKSALGNYDFLSLLDYVQMTMLRLDNFMKEFLLLDRTELDYDFITTFKIFCVPLELSLEVKVDVNDIENLDFEKDIKIVTRVGTVNENEIKNLAAKCPKGLDFFKSFSNVLQEYLELKKKRSVFAKGQG